MPATYEPIATTTLGSAASTITFSSLSSSYTDLRLVVSGVTSAILYTYLRFNSDTGSNYSWTQISGDGTSAASERATSQTSMYFNNNYFINSSTAGLWTADIFSYAGSTNKTALLTASQDSGTYPSVLRVVGLWRSTSAINSISFISSSNMNSGTTATLYGILKA